MQAEFVELGKKGVDHLDMSALYISPCLFRWIMSWCGELTRMASPGSLPPLMPLLAAVKDSTSSIMTKTKQSGSCTIAVMVLKSFCTSLPDSENHLEKSECELISTNRAPER